MDSSSCCRSLLVLATLLGLATAAAAAAPEAQAGDPQEIECVFPGGTVELDGTGSSDPDSDPLTYSWTNASGLELSTEAMPTLTLPVGENA